MSTKSKKTKQFNVLMSQGDLTLLEELSQAQEISKGLCIRLAVKYAHSHIVLRAPRCPNGQPCYVPQMHQQANAAPARPPDV